MFVLKYGVKQRKNLTVTKRIIISYKTQNSTPLFNCIFNMESEIYYTRIFYAQNHLLLNKLQRLFPLKGNSSIFLKKTRSFYPWLSEMSITSNEIDFALLISVIFYGMSSLLCVCVCVNNMEYTQFSVFFISITLTFCSLSTV